MTIYGIPNCDVTRNALKYFRARDISVRFHDLKKEGVPKPALDKWSLQRGTQSLLNKRGTTWRGLSHIEQESAANDIGAEALMIKYPSLVKRPVIELNGEIWIGFNEAESSGRV